MRFTPFILLAFAISIVAPVVGQIQTSPAATPAKVRARGAILWAKETYPTWMGKDDLLFYTRRPPIVDGKIVKAQDIGENGEFGNTDGLALYSPTLTGSKFRSLVQMPWAGQPSAYSPVSRRIAFSTGTQTGLLSLEAENLEAVNKNRVFRFDASWSPDGNSLVMSGTHSPSDWKDKKYRYDRDLFISQIKPQLGSAPLINNRCIVRIHGLEKLPVYDNTGEWIYFAHNSVILDSDEDSQQKRKDWTICRVKAKSTWPENQKPEVVASGLGEPDRLTFFDNGKRLLVSSLCNWIDERPVAINVIDVTNKTIRPLKLDPIFDPDRPEAGAILPRQMTVRSDGKKLAFSALLWSGTDGDPGWVNVYTSDFDGKNVQRITPLDRTAIPAYEYKNKKIISLNIWDEAFKLF